MTIPDFLKPKKVQSATQTPAEVPSFLKPKQKQPTPNLYEGENNLEREIERNQAQFTSRAIAGQISFYVDPTNIVILAGVGAPTITSGLIILEWLSQP